MFLYCLDDPTQVEIFGDYQTYGFKQLNIEYNLCTPQKLDDSQKTSESSTTCKSEKDLRKVDKNAFMVTLTNQVRFDATKFREESVIKESTLRYIPVQT